ncbi:RPAP1-like protein [Dipodascopsis uninucleata]
MDLVKDILERPMEHSARIEVNGCLREEAREATATTGDENTGIEIFGRPSGGTKRQSLWRSRRRQDIQDKISSGERPSAHMPVLVPCSGKKESSKYVERQNTKSKNSRDIDIDTEAHRISMENDKKIASMSSEEIAAEREALRASLPPGLISRILARDSSVADAILGPQIDEVRAGSTNDAKREEKLEQEVKPKTEKKVKFSEEFATEDTDQSSSLKDLKDQNAPDVRVDSIHFPAPPRLDPDAPDFLEKLHQQYFPELPADPSALAWMKPVTEEEDESSPYNPHQDSLLPADIRFDFQGQIVPPSKSRTLPVTLGLHHHSDSPGYAGYTIPELSHLCRSAVPAQRAIAVQIMGRILYRLGKYTYGDYVSDVLWDIVDHTRVVDSIYEASDENKTRHMGLRTCAIDALWLWKKGGGRRRKAE